MWLSADDEVKTQRKKYQRPERPGGSRSVQHYLHTNQNCCICLCLCDVDAHAFVSCHQNTQARERERERGRGLRAVMVDSASHFFICILRHTDRPRSSRPRSSRPRSARPSGRPTGRSTNNPPKSRAKPEGAEVGQLQRHWLPLRNPTHLTDTPIPALTERSFHRSFALATAGSIERQQGRGK